MKLIPATRTSPPEQLVADLVDAGYDRETIEKTMTSMADDELFLSDCGTYQVLVRRNVENQFGAEMTWISIKRVDREPIHDWRHLQQIKNAVVGPECEAIEIYPAESRLVDSANQFHLWAFNDPEVRIPVGFLERLVTDAPVRNTKQRPFR